MAAAAALSGYRSKSHATGVAPLRFIQIFVPFHLSLPIFVPPKADGTGRGTGTDFRLDYTNSILAPLIPYQNKMIMFRGLNYQDLIGKNVIGGHMSPSSMFTGASCTYGSAGSGQVISVSGTSLDQYLFSRLKHPGSLQPMVLGVKPANEPPISYANNIGLNAESNPQNTFKAYFSNLQTSATPSSGQTAALNRRIAALAFAQKSLQPLLAQLQSQGQQRLIQHATALDGLRNQLQSGSSGASCTPPPASSIVDDPYPGRGVIEWTKMVEVTSAFSSLIAHGFACDVTRFASLRYTWGVGGGSESGAIKYMPGLSTLNISNFHGDVSHSANGASATGTNDILLSHWTRYWLTQVKNLMDKLNSMSDPYSPDQKILDNTVILVGFENGLAYPGVDAHAYEDVPFLLLGGCGGNFRMGRIVECSGAKSGTPSFVGVPHNALLGAIANAFELNYQAVNSSHTPRILSQYGSYAATPLVLG